MVKTNIFKFAISVILSQLNTLTRQWNSVAFWLQKMGSAEQNYNMSESEILVIVKVCKH